ncbi:MmcB family DNA repair protein [Lysinibacillus sphaericus]|uniref:MmcB family DNA repair protein n=1 Tax=Lysinibacillus sphaericus TaxID=1421 RepID=UPI00321196D0
MNIIAKTETTLELERAISVATNKTGVFSCYEVTIGMGGNERVDFMTLDTKGIFRCYEIKSSIADFHSKAIKSFVGHYNYFVLTKELYEAVESEIPKHIGVYVYGSCVKKAKKQSLTTYSDDVLQMSLLRSLYREAVKYRQSLNPRIIENFNREILKLKDERNHYREEHKDLRNKIIRQYGYHWDKEKSGEGTHKDSLRLEMKINNRSSRT